MGELSKIEWTTHTFNPVIGCQKVSPGCQFCYAEEMMDKRYGKAKWGPQGTRVVTSEANWKQPLKWNRDAEKAGERARVFCASLSDVFEDRPEWNEPRARLFDLIRQTPALDWLLLTKRPASILSHLQYAFTHVEMSYEATLMVAQWLKGNPPANVWLGTSVENQDAADERIPHLLQVPAAVRFLSCEPLLGPVDLRNVAKTQFCETDCLKGFRYTPYQQVKTEKIHWVICGGESGPNARAMHPDWARSLRDQCNAAGVAFHFKQWGEWLPERRHPENISLPERAGMIALNPDGSEHKGSWNRVHCVEGTVATKRVGKKAAGRLLDGREWNELPEVKR